MKLAKWIACLVVGVACLAWASDELTLSTGWTYNKNSRKRTVVTTSTDWDISGDYVIENVQLISTNTAGDALTLGSVTTAGFGWFHNADATNYVEIGIKDGSANFFAFLKLDAGQSCPAWLGTTQLLARASTNSVKLDYVLTDR